MRQLKRLGMNRSGLTKFYCANIRSVLSYAAPVFYNLLSDTVKSKLENVQAAATRIILPDMSYDKRLDFLHLPTLDVFMTKMTENHFMKIAGDSTHPLFSKIIFNCNKRSSRLHTIYRPPRCKNEKRRKSFFPAMMSVFNTTCLTHLHCYNITYSAA